MGSTERLWLPQGKGQRGGEKREASQHAGKRTPWAPTHKRMYATHDPPRPVSHLAPGPAPDPATMSAPKPPPE